MHKGTHTHELPPTHPHSSKTTQNMLHSLNDMGNGV